MPPRPDQHHDPDLGQLVMHLSKEVRRQRARALEPFGLVDHQARAFMAVVRAADRDHDLRPSDLAARLRIAPRSATEVLDALEGKGLIERRPSPTDRRSTQIALTDAGRQLHLQLNRQRADRADDLFGVLTEDEAAMLGALLTKVLSALDADYP